MKYSLLNMDLIITLHVRPQQWEVWQNVELLNLINLLECLKLRLVLNVLDSTNIYIT